VEGVARVDLHEVVDEDHLQHAAEIDGPVQMLRQQHGH
jgi:hypothetical protein